MASLKSLLRNRKPSFCTFVAELDSPGMGHILASAGADFAFLDMEHSGFGIESIKRSLRYYEAAGLPVLVRPPSTAYHHIARVLDAGADGVCLPMVSTAEQAKAIVDCVKYPPAGQRGVGLQLMHDHFKPSVPADQLAAINRRTCVVLQIETAEGVENVEAIAATKHVDMLWIGHFDLSVSLGIAGQFTHKDFTAAVARVSKACRSNNICLGIIAGSVEHGIDLMKKGFTTISYSLDAHLIRDSLRGGIDGLRAGIPAAAKNAKTKRPTKKVRTR